MTRKTKLRIVVVFVLALIATATAAVVLTVHMLADTATDRAVLYFASGMVEIFCCVHIYSLVNSPMDIAVSK